MKSAVVPIFVALVALAALMWLGGHGRAEAQQTGTTGIVGTVYELRTHDTSAGPPGPPVPNARITVQPLGLTTTSAADGTFAILGIDWDTVPKDPPPPEGTRPGMVPETGRLTVAVEATGFGTYTIINLPVYERDYVILSIALSSEPTTSDKTCIPLVIASFKPGCEAALSPATAPTTGGGSRGPSAPVALAGAFALIAATLLGAGLARRRTRIGARR